MIGSQEICWTARSMVLPSRSRTRTPSGVSTAMSPSARKNIFLVWARIAGMSLATKYSPCPRPITEGGAVRAPARVADAVLHVDRGLPDYFLKVVKFPRCTPDFHFAVRSDNGDSCGIIAAIFQPPQAVEDERNDFLGADISDDSTHCFLSERGS